MKGVRCILALAAILSLTSPLFGVSLERERLGTSGAWKGTLAVAVINDWIYTAEQNGGLYRTNPYTGAWSQVGDNVFGETKFMFALGGWLYTIENDGSLYRVSAGNGAWQRIGERGAWFDTVAGAAVPFDQRDGALMTAESSGRLIATASNGLRLQVGKAEFNNTRFMFLVETGLYTLEADGSLYGVNPANGSWRRIGTSGAWLGAIAGTGMGDRLYLVREDGGLTEVAPMTGVSRQLLPAGLEDTRYLFAVAGALYSIERNGDLYRHTLSSPNIQRTRTKLDLTPLEGNRLQARLEYIDTAGATRSETFNGSRDEIRQWLENLPGLPPQDLEKLLQAVEMAGRVRTPPTGRTPFGARGAQDREPASAP